MYRFLFTLAFTAAAATPAFPCSMANCNDVTNPGSCAQAQMQFRQCLNEEQQERIRRSMQAPQESVKKMFEKMNQGFEATKNVGVAPPAPAPVGCSPNATACKAD